MAQAYQQVAAVRAFYTHFVIFAIVVTVLFAINAVADDEWWAQWVFIGWGIGVASHAIAIFGQTPGFVQRWERRKLRQFMGR
jgi:hypothetical protein